MNPNNNPEDIDFYKYWLILKIHWLPSACIFGLTVLIAIIAAFVQTEIFRASGKLKLKKNDSTSALITEKSAKISRLEALEVINSPLDTEAEVIRSYPIVTQTIAELDLKDLENENELVSYQAFLENLEVGSIPGTDILLISYKSPQPEIAIKIVDKLMKIYQENNIKVNRTEAAAARELINQQLPKNQQSVAEAEVALRNFKKQHGTVDLEIESNLYVSQISQLDHKIEQNKALLERLSSRIDNLEAQLGLSAEEVLSLNNINDSEAIQSTIIQLQEVTNQLAQEESRFSDRNPVVIDLKEEQALTEALLQRQIGRELGKSPEFFTKYYQAGDIQKHLAEELIRAEVERKELVEEIASLEKWRAEYQQKTNNIPILQQEQGRLERQLEAAQTAYQNLLNNLQQVLITENQNVGNAQIISKAIANDSPISTSKKQILVLGIFAGGVLAVITPFMLEIIDPSIKTSKELHNLLDCTLLGIIPDSYRKVVLPGRGEEWVIPERHVVDAPNTIISEAYRMLQANLKFLSHNQNIQTIVITSALPKEGKSTVSANMAGVLAQLKNRVLLIDGDLHSPQQHNIWRLSNQIGLSNVVFQRDKLVIGIKTVSKNMDVLTSGDIHPNALALLESAEMESLISSLKNNYDYIIIDTPPLLLFADALTLSKLANGVLLVARPGIIDREGVKAAEEILRKSGQNIWGLVANGVITENEPDNHLDHAEKYHQEDNRGGKKLPSS